MKELITYIARSLVDNPDKVSVFEVESGRTSIFELTVSKEDIGKVIGKEGKTAKAMRTIVSAAASKMRKNYILEIME
ncbi:MAG: KH domain-containing protein [Deltaproteobacteria bacterium]|nr:KH domain-containing protein [Deltaproteobacteria bacterium]MBN2688866.1 KH domain-containing protein [Deltaproteobacteria bacterium]